MSDEKTSGSEQEITKINFVGEIKTDGLEASLEEEVVSLAIMNTDTEQAVAKMSFDGITIEGTPKLKSEEVPSPGDTTALTNLFGKKPTEPRRTTRDKRVQFSKHQMQFAEALTGHAGQRAVEMLVALVLTFYGDPQAVLDSVPEELPDWAK
jgi:hypothetical protein